MSDNSETEMPGQALEILSELAGPGMHHWRQTPIVDATLDVRDNVFFAVLEMTRMPMILADPRQQDCPIAFANNAFLELTGYEEAEVVGRNCRFLQGPETDRELVRQLRDAVVNRQPVSLEILNYRRDGTPFWNAVFMGPVYDQSGQLIYFFASQLDVSKRREGERNLRQAQKMEAIGELTSGLAHDFNNLLQIVMGSLERMTACRGDDLAFERHHGAAISASARAARITQQLLAFARRTRLEPRDVDLSQLVHEFADLLETSLGSGLHLDLVLRRRLPPVKLDPTHLEMALLNVVANARDASTPGGVITVSTGNAGPAGLLESGDNGQPRQWVSLSVRDQGTGMPEHVRLRAIEPFFTTKALGKGTGLGLAMVHGFVQQSGGVLEIDSEPGQGTTVRMLFPLARAPETLIDEAPLSTGYQTRTVECVEGGTESARIMVVDDSPEIAELARETLADIGYRVDVCHDADAALALFEQARAGGDAHRLVFSDVMMPGGPNGLVLAENLRRLDPVLRVILTTGYNDEMSLDSPRAGALEVLGKPYRPSELVDRVQSALGRDARTGPGRTLSDFGHAQA